MPRRVSPAGIALIKRFEGFRARAYKDAVGIPTIGYGHVIRPRDNIVPPITEDQADALMREDLASIELYLTGVLPALTQDEFDAVASFAFNVGLKALENSTLMRHLRAGDRIAAANQFPRWVHAGDRPLPGLVKRRQAERTLFLGGVV